MKYTLSDVLDACGKEFERMDGLELKIGESWIAQGFGVEAKSELSPYDAIVKLWQKLNEGNVSANQAHPQEDK